MNRWELDKLEARMPQIWNADKTWEGRMKSIISSLQEEGQQELQIRGEQGYTIPPTLRRLYGMEDMVEMLDPEGTPYRVPSNQVDVAIREHQWRRAQ